MFKNQFIFFNLFIRREISYHHVPQLFPDECKYNTDKQLGKKLKNLVKAGTSRIKVKAEDLKLKERLIPRIAKEIVLENILKEINF